MTKTDFTRREWLKAAATGMATGVSLRTPSSVYAAESPAEPARKATDYQRLAQVDFLPGLDKLDLGEKAKVIQSLLEENFFHPSGLFYSILMITGPHTLRPMSRTTSSA